MSAGVLLNAAPDVVDDGGGGGELDDMKRIEHGASVVELVTNRVLVPPERVQRGDLHPGAERLPPLGEPTGVRLPGDQVQQLGPGPGVGVTGEVHHPGQLLEASPTGLDRLGGDVVPDVLIHA